MAGTAKKAPASKTTKPRVRRTRAQIEADNAAEQARRDQLAAERASRIPAPVAPKFSRTFHFVADGHTALGEVWYRGQEVTIEEGTPEFELAFDSKGNFIFGKDENEQIEFYGEVRYREGPWTGLPYDLSVYEPGQVNEEGKEIKANAQEIAALKKANKKLQSLHA